MTLKIIQNIPKLDDLKLSKLFVNAQRLLDKNEQNKDAQEVLRAIKDEWDRRLRLFHENKYKALTPKNGVLSVIGYKVGNEGEKTSIRRKMLDYIMSETLPPVASPAYMAEWGENLSKDRYQKLHRVLRALATGGATMGNMDKAVSEWEDDLEYIENKWQNSI